MKILIMYEDDNGVDYDKHDIMDVPEYNYPRGVQSKRSCI